MRVSPASSQKRKAAVAEANNLSAARIGLGVMALQRRLPAINKLHHRVAISNIEQTIPHICSASL